MTSNVRNVLIIAAIAAVIAFVPGGGTTSGVILQAIWVVLAAATVWVAAVMYRERRSELYALGDRRRAALYGALVVIAVSLTAIHRLWSTPAGQIAWLVLMGSAIYVVFAVFWAARRY
jgi:hypothetical protein